MRQSVVISFKSQVENFEERKMIPVFHPHDPAIDTVLQVAHSLQTESITQLRCLRRDSAAPIIPHGQMSCLAQMNEQFEAIIEALQLEFDIDGKYREALQLCKNTTDRVFVHIFTKERRADRMRLLRQVMNNLVSQIACNEQLAVGMRYCVDYMRSLHFPEYEDENDNDHEMVDDDVGAMEENIDVPITAAFKKQVAVDFVHLFADLMYRRS